MREDTARRSFLARLGATAAALGISESTTSAQSPPPPPPATDKWQPARHAQDDWLEQLPGKHRIFFDCLQAQGTGEAIAFANNFIDGNKTSYGLEPADLAIVLCLRHTATLLAFNDSVWAKYGGIFADQLKLDLKGNPPPTTNPRSPAFANLIKKGVHFAVCDMATHRNAGIIARRTDGKAEDVYKDFAANLIGNAHFVAAGIIGVNRAQERGYTIAFAG